MILICIRKSLRVVSPRKHWLDKDSYGAIYSNFFLKKIEVSFLAKQSIMILVCVSFGRVLIAGTSEHTLSKLGSEGNSYESDRCRSYY